MVTENDLQWVEMGETKGLLLKQGAREIVISANMVNGADIADNEELLKDITMAYLKYRSHVDSYIKED